MLFVKTIWRKSFLENFMKNPKNDFRQIVFTNNIANSGSLNLQTVPAWTQNFTANTLHLVSTPGDTFHGVTSGGGRKCRRGDNPRCIRLRISRRIHSSSSFFRETHFMARHAFGCAIQKSDGEVTTLGVLDSEFHGESTRLGFNSGRHISRHGMVLGMPSKKVTERGQP